MANLTACHRDPKYWKNPDKFFPEHFLDSEGKFTEEKEGFVPFGYGKTFYQMGKKSAMGFFQRRSYKNYTISKISSLLSAVN